MRGGEKAREGSVDPQIAEARHDFSKSTPFQSHPTRLSQQYFSLRISDRMQPDRKAPSVSLVLLFFLTAWLTQIAKAEISVQSLSDKATYIDRVGFRVQIEEDYSYQATLDGQSVAPQFWHFAGPGYHQFRVVRTHSESQESESRLYRFVVQDSVRGNSEWGLAPWTPRPLIPSASTEFEGAHIELVYPKSLPKGMPLPLSAWIKQPDGEVRRVNGELDWAWQGERTVIRRGVGSLLLSLESTQGTVSGRASIADLSVPWEIQIEETTDWIQLSGTIETNLQLERQARVLVAQDLTIPANTTLTIQAGTILAFSPNVSVTVDGSLVVKGEASDPVLMAPRAENELWGGFYFRTLKATAHIEHAIVTGSGSHKTWFFANRGGRSHRPEQAAFNFWRGTSGTLSHVQIIDNTGQALHGEDATIELDHCLIQRCQTVGQFNEGSVSIESSALIEFPTDSPEFVDGDNDALYFTFGDHSIRNTLIGWTKDDGIDAGGNDPGTVHVENCWIESCFHEGMALSGTQKIVNVSGTVFINNGQGVEAGYLSPKVTVTDSLFTGNSVGLRFGDNYFREHSGSLDATRSISIFNHRDIWGLTANLWDEDLRNLKATENLLGSGLEKHPQNELWLSEAEHPESLNRYLQLPDSSVGIGFFQKHLMAPSSPTTLQLEVGLSRFSKQTVTARVVMLPGSSAIDSTLSLPDPVLHFSPGQTTATLALKFSGPGLAPVASKVRLGLTEVSNAVANNQLGELEISIAGLTTEDEVILRGSEWRYVPGTDQEAPSTIAWRFPSYDDSEWQHGSSPLGYGLSSLGLPLTEMRDHYTSLFLRQTFSLPRLAQLDKLILDATYDDGFIAWINGTEIVRSGAPAASDSNLPLTATATQPLDQPVRNQWEIATKDLPSLLPGTNQLAIRVLNESIGSPDLYFDTSLRLRTSLDLDGDQLPDSWEEEVILRSTENSLTSILELHPDGDLDADAASNLSEYIAGTDPLDSESHLKLLLQVAALEEHLKIGFTQNPQRRYELQESPAPQGPWTTLRDIAPITITNQWNLIVPKRRSTGYYRVIAFF